MAGNDFLVTTEKAFDSKDDAAVLIKLQGSLLEVNVYVPALSIDRLLSFFAENRDYCCAGESANSKVHWSRGDEGVAYILIGEDQEVWDIGITCDEALFDEIAVQIREFSRGQQS